MKRLWLGTIDGIWCCEQPGEEAYPLALAGTAITQLLATGSATVYATDGRHIWWSGDQWGHARCTELPDGAPITVLARSPHPPHPLFAGSIPARLFRSDDAGENWHVVEGFDRTPGHQDWTFPGATPHPRVNAIAFDAQRAEALFVSVEVGGLIRSLDGGTTWHSCSDAVNRDAHFLAAHPTVSGVIYASMGFGTQQPGGVYRSSDYGSNWHYCFEHLQPSYTRAILLDSRNDTLYVTATPQQPPFWALADGPLAVLWYGKRGGDDWRILYRCGVQAEPEKLRLITALALDPKDPESLLLATSDLAPALHAVGALGRPPGGPFPLPAAAPPATAPEVARARYVLQQQLAAEDREQSSRGSSTIRQVSASGSNRVLLTAVPTTLTMLWV